MTIRGELQLKITDNGRGFDVPASQESFPPAGGRIGNGLNNMRQRLMEIGGECLIDSRPGLGTTIIMRIRLNQKMPKFK
jgi:signal transduction histidine kinase